MAFGYNAGRSTVIPSQSGWQLQVDRDFVFIVSLANQFANHLSIGSAGDCVIDNQLIEYLNGKIGVEWTILHELGETVLNEIEKAKIFLEIAQKG